MATILYNIIISPIELVVEVVFELMWRLVGQHQTNQGLAVIGVSVAISLLTLPLYRRADTVQQKERDLQKSLSYWVNHIKKSFKGDERYMMLQAYYRQNGYSPIMALNGAVSLLLEIPFFMAAYHFLSHLEALKGASFGLITDMGTPDGLIRIGSFSLNLLPVFMTAINCLSAAIYLKGFPIKDKIQTYGMALIFLVLLYNSPAGLVVYWTCNNIFSLVKNVFYKMKNPKKVAVILCAILGTFFTLSLVISNALNSRKKILVVMLFQYIVLFPVFCYLYEKQNKKHNFSFIFEDNGNITLFILSGAILALLSGFVVPLNIIASSPSEFIFNGQNPLHYISVSFSKAFGLFFAWPLCLRILFKNEKSGRAMDLLFICFACMALLNVFVFPMKAGLVSIFLKYDNEEQLLLSYIGIKKLILNFLTIFTICFLILFVLHKKLFFVVKMICVVISVSLLILGVHNVNIVHKAFAVHKGVVAKSSSIDGDIEPIYHFTKTGKNVVCIMLDRAAGAYLPYIFDERPNLYDDYEGFTYYPNTVSFSLYTLAGAPPLYGGYEYVPALQNLDSEKTLLQKREDAISMLPRLFSQNGYSATMTNMPWIGETKTSDFYFMDKYPEKITSLFTNHKYRDAWITEKNNVNELSNSAAILNRNFICNGIASIVPYIVRNLIYDKGQYIHTSKAENVIESKNFEGNAWSLLNDYSELDMLPQSCDTTSTQDAFFFLQNPMPHHPAYLQYPDYTISQNIVLDEKNPLSHDSHFHVNAASLILLGKWLRWLKENGVYDNTRIIISADHGAGSVRTDWEGNLPECQAFPDGGVQPLLLYKDFNQHDILKIDNSFMTNADVPSLAVCGLIGKPINPVTGKDITSFSLKNPAFITLTDWQETKRKYGDVDSPLSFALNDENWYEIKDSIFESENWKKITPTRVYDNTVNQMEANQ